MSFHRNLHVNLKNYTLDFDWVSSAHCPHLHKIQVCCQYMKQLNTAAVTQKKYGDGLITLCWVTQI